MTAAFLLGALGAGGLLQSAAAQEQPVVPPTVEEEDVQVKRGEDVVQIPSLWYQEGDEAPDSLGVLRVARPSGDPDAITYSDTRYGFPVNLQFATFVKNGQIAELPLDPSVINGQTSGRIIIRPPAADHYDVAEPFGVEPIKQVPGEETIIDAQEWYRASLVNPTTGEQAPANRYHVTRELRGHLRSTAPGGERVQFVIPARRMPSRVPQIVSPVNPVPPVRDRYIVSEVHITGLNDSPIRPLDWTTTVALLAGPNRADIPGRNGDYEANRIKGDVASTLRWHVNRRESYELSFYGSSQATYGSGQQGNHHDVPYGLAVGARFGGMRAFKLEAEAAFEDDPFQAQSFASGDERLRLLLGVDYRSDAPPIPATQWTLSAGPTYLLDQPSSWEGSRSDARELGISVRGRMDHRFDVGSVTTTVELSAHGDQTWGYIDDAGNSNTTVDGRIGLKPNFRVGSTHVEVGPVGYVQYIDNTYADIAGFSEFNLQFGLEATSRVFF